MCPYPESVPEHPHSAFARSCIKVQPSPTLSSNRGTPSLVQGDHGYIIQHGMAMKKATLDTTKPPAPSVYVQPVATDQHHVTKLSLSCPSRKLGEQHLATSPQQSKRWPSVTKIGCQVHQRLSPITARSRKCCQPQRLVRKQRPLQTLGWVKLGEFSSQRARHQDC